MTIDSKGFTLYAIREIIDSYHDSPPLFEILVEQNENSVNEGLASTFELSKSLIDTTCKTILTDKGIDINGNWDTPQLFRETLNRLNFVPPGHPNPQAFRGSITSVIRGLQTAIQGFAELRNSEGIIAHGQDGYQKTFFFYYQLQFVARVADAIVNFIFNAHRRNPENSKSKRIYYEDNTEFNEYIDDIHKAVIIFDQYFPASKILYESDKEHASYKEKLLEWEIDVQDGLIILNS